MNVTMKQVEGGVCAAAGFSANGLNCGLNPDRNKNDLALIWSEKECTAACCLYEHLLHYLFVEKHHSGEFLRVILFHETDVFFILFYRYGIDEKSLTSASDLDFRYHLPL